MNTDTLTVIKEMGQSSVNWLQILIQSSIISGIFLIIVELVRRRFQKELETLKNEFAIIQTIFEKNHSFIFDYYTNFHKHYRACQKVVSADVIEFPDQTTIDTEELFMDNLDIYVNELNEIEPKIRLIFPHQLILIHENAIRVFNNFRGLVKSYYKKRIKPKDDIIFAFRSIDEIKKELEEELKKYLRTEKLFSN
ncbi:MAG: hypothetical protein MUO34_11940 [Ignavibacteriaceae bacterium]|nr:hypothetical protein [Ignavibacteriaceae bacterium]